MRRKLQQTGGSTLIVSLPKDWVRRMKLKKGDEVDIIETENYLLISPRTEIKDEAEITMTREDSPEATARRLVSLYLAGFNKISFKSEERICPRFRGYLKRFARTKLVGTEIIEDLPSRLSLRILLSPSELPIPEAVRRMGIITQSMIKDAYSSLRELDMEIAKDVLARDDEVDRFGIYIVRLLKAVCENRIRASETGLREIRECLGYRVIVKSIERVADYAVSIAKNVMTIEEPLPSSILKRVGSLVDFSSNLFSSSLQSLEKSDYRLAEWVIQRGRSVSRFVKPVLVSIFSFPASGALPLRMIVGSLQRIAEHSTDIAEIVLNLTVPKHLS